MCGCARVPIIIIFLVLAFIIQLLLFVIQCLLSLRCDRVRFCLCRRRRLCLCFRLSLRLCHGLSSGSGDSAELHEGGLVEELLPVLGEAGGLPECESELGCPTRPGPRHGLRVRRAPQQVVLTPAHGAHAVRAVTNGDGGTVAARTRSQCSSCSCSRSSRSSASCSCSCAARGRCRCCGHVLHCGRGDLEPAEDDPWHEVPQVGQGDVLEVLLVPVACTGTGTGTGGQPKPQPKPLRRQLHLGGPVQLPGSVEEGHLFLLFFFFFRVLTVVRPEESPALRGQEHEPRVLGLVEVDEPVPERDHSDFSASTSATSGGDRDRGTAARRQTTSLALHSLGGRGDDGLRGG